MAWLQDQSIFKRTPTGLKVSKPDTTSNVDKFMQGIYGDAYYGKRGGATLGLSHKSNASNGVNPKQPNNTQLNTRPNDKVVAPTKTNKDEKSKTSDYENAMKKQAEAELRSLNTQYDRTKSDLESQMGYLGSQRSQGMQALQNALSGFQNQVGRARTSAGEETDRAISEAASTAQETVRSNRNTLRGLGILSSSAAGDILSRPTQAFDVERANLKRQFTSRLSELDDYLNQKSSEHALAVQQLESNYANLVSKIQRDLRFNDRERADAVKEAQAALSYNIAQIQLQQQQAEQLYNQQMASLSDASTLISAQDYDPTTDLSAIEGTYINAGDEETGSDAQVYVNPMSDEDYQSAQLQNQVPLTRFYQSAGVPQRTIAANTNGIGLSSISSDSYGMPRIGGSGRSPISAPKIVKLGVGGVVTDRYGMPIIS